MHEPTFGTSGYNTFYRAQQYELTGRREDNQGSLFEFWMDGAFGSDVTQEVRDGLDWRGFVGEIRDSQPGALIAFTYDIQWSGTEAGSAPETFWNNRNNIWTPIECDMAFRSGWFWHPNEDPKPLDEMVDVYFRTVGRDCVLLLGLAPDRRGLLEDEDVQRLAEWRHELDRLLARNWADNAPATASSVRPGSDGWAAGAATDGEPESFWASAEQTPWLEVDLGTPRSVSIIEVAEPVRYGQRVAAYHVDAYVGTEWVKVVSGTTVGRRRLDRVAPVVAQKWRLVIDGARAEAAISTFALYEGGR